MADKRAVIFCSASKSIDPKYNQAAREVVRAACLSGYDIVSGGTVKGTMGVVSEEALKCGARHKGVIPRFMEDVVYPDLDEVVWTETMSERKEEMRKGTDLAIALPGGIGTMDELMETLVLAKLDIYKGRILAYNIDGFYEPLKELLNKFVWTNMLEKRDEEKILFPESIEELKKLI
ncbi:MAG: TIGR00730 family Rossman fold protein [Bacteroidales bacterium]|nr:TIGR00730 family Rossman fold protein [Bacteroidales bacterium]